MVADALRSVRATSVDIATSDPGDIEPLAVLAGRHVELLRV
jgi:hypothetical protein